MDEGARMSAPIVGGSSLLVIFAVLCLTVFALLGLSTIQAGGRLSQATTQAVSDYYQADYQAEEIFAHLRSGEMPAGVTSCNCGEEGYAYACPISDTQRLVVEVHFDGKEWTVLRWQAESTAEWNVNDDLNIWDGS